MSPSIHFPSPFRGRDLPPYGAADWKRLQPVLLRRSLALSSASALLAGLLLGLLLHRNVEQAPEPKVFSTDWTGPKDPPPPTPQPEPKDRPVVVHDSKDGRIVESDTTFATIEDPKTPSPAGWLTVGGPGGGDSRVPENRGGWVDTFPDRPPPDEFAALDDPPLPVYSPKPKYPDLAQQAGIEGQVVIKVLVDRQGRVTELLHVTSTPIFDDAAEKALRTWRFRPALVGHHPVPAWVVVPVRFVMQ